MVCLSWQAVPHMCAQVLAPCAARININGQILALYLGHLLPGIAQPGSDNNFGSSALADVLALQVGGS
jgi:chorismate mutase